MQRPDANRSVGMTAQNQSLLCTNRFFGIALCRSDGLPVPSFGSLRRVEGSSTLLLGQLQQADRVGNSCAKGCCRAVSGD